MAIIQFDSTRVAIQFQSNNKSAAVLINVHKHITFNLSLVFNQVYYSICCLRLFRFYFESSDSKLSENNENLIYKMIYMTPSNGW